MTKHRLSLPGHSYIIVGHLIFVVLGVLAAIFWKERILFSDNAYLFFETANGRAPFFLHGRFILAAILFPFSSSIAAGTPLLTAAAQYSVWLVVWPWLWYVVLVYGFRQYLLGFLWALLQIVFVGSSFCFPASAVNFAFPFVLLAVYATTNAPTPRSQAWRYALLAVCCLTAVWNHMLLAVTLGMVVAFNVFWRYGRFRLADALTIAFTLAAYVLRSVSGLSAYDQEKMNILGILKSMLGFYKWNCWTDLYTWLVTDYWMSLALCLLLVVVLHRPRPWRQRLLYAAGYLAVATAYLLLVQTLATNRAEGFHEYMENDYQLIAFWLLLLPLCPPGASLRAAWERLTARWMLVLPVLALLLLARFALIEAYTGNYTQRLAMLEQVIQHTRQQGYTHAYILRENQFTPDVYLDWGLPLEATLLSNSGTGQPAVAIAMVKENEPEPQTPANAPQNIIWGPFNWDGTVHPALATPEGTYRPLNTCAPDSAAAAALRSQNTGAVLATVASSCSGRHGSLLRIPVVLRRPGRTLLPSSQRCPYALRMAATLNGETQYTPLWYDVTGAEHSQWLLVRVPAPGTYTVQLDLETAGLHRWGCGGSFTLVAY